MINFPDAPTINQLFTTAGKTWLWNGTKWIAYTSGGGSVEALAREFKGQRWDVDKSVWK
jgi:hypothetical protein